MSVIEATMGSARGGSSRRGRPKKSSDNDSNDDGADHSSRVVSSGVTERAGQCNGVDALPKPTATKKSSRNGDKAAAAATNASAELELPAVSKSETHETLEGVLSSTSSSPPHQHTKKSSSATEMPSPGLSPIQNTTEKEVTKETTSSSSSSIALAPQGLVSLPVVTRATRRETFATTKAPKKKERKVKRSTGENSPQSSTSSSGVDETIMDLFAPPQSTRTRSRPSSSSATTQAKTVRPPEITITASSSSSLSKAEAAGGKSQQKQASSSTTPSKFAAATPSTKRKPRNSPKTPADTKKTGRGSAERKALSTTNKKQYAAAGTLVHLPRPSPYRYGSHFDPFISFHKSPPWEIDVMQKSTESAPAKMPVSTSIAVVDWLPHHIHIILIGCCINSIFFAPSSNSILFLTCVFSLSSLPPPYSSIFSDFSTCNSTSRG